jgi:hypothetical protein
MGKYLAPAAKPKGIESSRGFVVTSWSPVWAAKLFHALGFVCDRFL